MLLEILKIIWLEKEHVIIDFNYNLIRKRLFFKRFHNMSWLEKEYVFTDFKIIWLEKDNVFRDFK